MPASSKARCAARLANVDVDVPTSAMRRVLMPVRSTIHSSVVSTRRSKSALVSSPSGASEPIPTMPMAGSAGNFAKRQPLQLAFDLLVDALARIARGDVDGVLDRFGRRAAVRDDDRAVDAQER